MSFNKIAVLGLGKVGHLAAELLVESGFTVTGIDARDTKAGFATKTVDLSDTAALKAALEGQEAVLSCLPYHLNIGVSTVAHGLGLHYFDLTEDVPTTKHIRELAKTSKGLMAPQCGLAPGFVGIVAADLANQFDSVRSIKLRVGALPQNPTGLLGYAFNWSPEGVVNEYLNDCEVIEEGVLKTVSAMEWTEAIYIDGMQLEAFTTSGGLGTMCETYLGKIENLDYKTMRYPGHVQLMNFFFHELLMRENRAEAGRILTNAKPPVDEDVVYVHVAAEGRVDGQMRRKEFVRSYYPVEIGGKSRTAIAWTTSASVVAVIEMVRGGALPQQGFLKQEDIPLKPYLDTRTGHYYQIGHRARHA
ncbi:saccharopine dehydrogenase (NAD+, L-lysine forming) [Gemmobacter caeni]|jgi:saccharopine dehydrogenase (NAD+, L-lysine-forming)|uniref:Saccharopine dehydrogenase-like NADP-dependent oxidoreductase n=2 Tax=Gemmobacter TaxID=204456 RepID=A0A2T6B6E3_9RHOB|nr:MULTISPECIES: saccharopine dehydrogenase C-terminal domain-containing protein [Gemmobacter]PTX51651.1 saccharopine dehydrogenase-like NADP-dependent oxidoreductase [Gemmobacter caeni]TWJ03779.1 saccharopine dehydrogenase (NAD+, L-lysine forming) [Gemmobacter caeni]GHC12265.1 saccharopine dehydrogenase [Gemmobacter nanjingensis]